MDDDFQLTESDFDIPQLEIYEFYLKRTKCGNYLTANILSLQISILHKVNCSHLLLNHSTIIKSSFFYIGKVSLVKRKIVVNSDLLRCSYCMSTICLHIQALQQCLEINSLVVCEASQFKEVVYYPLNIKSVFLIDSETFHLFYCKNHNWICNTCPNNCKMHSTLQAIIKKSDYWIDTSNHMYHPIEYPTISTNPIPTTLNDKLVSIYSRQLSEGINLPALLLPEIQYCPSNFQFNTVLERTGIIIYAENDVLELTDHKGK